MTREMHLFGETIQDITLTAWPIVWADNKYDQDSRVVLEMLRDWAEAFEAWWNSHDQDWRDRNSHYCDVHDFAERKARAYVRELEGGPSGIMDSTNNHNPAMVYQINEKWDRFRENFRPILCALYERDIKEILDSDAFGFSPAPDVEVTKVYMKDHWEEEAENYLMHIADDQDLETILTFVRFDVCEGTGRDRISI